MLPQKMLNYLLVSQKNVYSLAKNSQVTSVNFKKTQQKRL
jgi:hypothetical protein